MEKVPNKNPLFMIEEEQRDHVAKLTKMEREMEEVIPLFRCFRSVRFFTGAALRDCYKQCLGSGVKWTESVSGYWSSIIVYPSLILFRK